MMTKNDIKTNFTEASSLLECFIADDSNFEQIAKAGDIIIKSIRDGGKVISCGNGGSMCDAMHFAEEMTGRFRSNRNPLPAVAVSDSSHITCTANDYGYEYIFSRFVDGIGREGDVLLAISTSGNSDNILKATEIATKKNMPVIALTGKDGGKLGTTKCTEIRVPHLGYADRIQEIHIKIIHSLIHYVESNL